MKVADRLPEDGIEVLIFLSNGDRLTGHYGENFLKEGKYWWQTGKGFGFLENITHWQPLPAAPTK